MSPHGAAVIPYSGDETVIVRHTEKSGQYTGKETYSIPSGRYAPGDRDSLDTGVRETWEETGLVIERKDLEFLKYLEGEIAHKEGMLPFNIDLYACEVDRDAVLYSRFETIPEWAKIEAFVRGDYLRTRTTGNVTEVIDGYMLELLGRARGRF